MCGRIFGKEEKREISVPLTVNVADRLTEPARFDAEQAYSPACLADTPSMLSVLRCLVILVTVILGSFDVSIATPLNAHDISMGMSPFKIEQGTDTESPELATSALKAIGRSCGPTGVIIRLDERQREREDLSLLDSRKKKRGYGEGEWVFLFSTVLFFFFTETECCCANNERTKKRKINACMYVYK